MWVAVRLRRAADVGGGNGRGTLFGVDVTVALTGVAFFLAVLAVFAAGSVATVALCGSVSVAGGTLHSGEIENSRGRVCGRIMVWAGREVIGFEIRLSKER